MTTSDIAAKLWNLCNILKDDGVTYHQYVTELTYLLFLKMAKETGSEDQIPGRLPLGRPRSTRPARRANDSPAQTRAENERPEPCSMT